MDFVLVVEGAAGERVVEPVFDACGGDDAGQKRT
jgi:hypothetical protein